MVDNVVTKESNPTGEDTSLDNAINDLYNSNGGNEERLKEAEKASKESVEEEAEENEAGDSEDENTESVDTEDSEDAEDGEAEEFKLPENMPKGLREKLESLDEEVQKASTEIFKQMHKNYTKKNQDLSKQSFLAESIDEAFKKSGFNVDNVKKKATIISNYVAFDKMLATDPVKAVKLLADRHNIKPEQLGYSPIKTDNGSSDLDDDLLTDSEKLLKQQLEATNQELNKLKQNFYSKENQEQLTAVRKFAEQTNDNGELLHPHFDKVKEDMMDLADVNPNMTIDQLYKKAVRMNDELYEETLKSERQRIIDESKKKKEERLKKAKAMSSQSLKQSGTRTTESLDTDAMLEKIAIESGFN